MGQSLSPHLSNAAILAVSVLVALAAERMGGAAATPRGMPRVSAGAAALDVGEYVRPVRGEMSFGRFHPVIRPDPFAPAAVRSEENIASQSGAPTVPSTAVRGSRLTAILVADDRRVAVIDDAAVSVGDMLRDGARVSAIQPDRVYLVERNGQWRMLTLTNRGGGTR